MRNAFAREIEDLAALDERVVLLSGDIGNRIFNSFKERFPDRFYNCGIAEANMMSVAAGLAMCNLRPVAYTITPFITVRCLEQIRLDVCYHQAPVTIVGVGAGFSYASLGATHHSCEDIAYMRLLPNMSVLCPGDPFEVRGALRSILAQDGPAYLRIGKKGEPTIHASIPDIEIGRAIVMAEGETVCILSTGNLLPIAIEAGQNLSASGISTRVCSVHTVKPLDEALLEEVFGSFRIVVTLEEHLAIGGLGGSVAEWVSGRPWPAARLLRIGAPVDFIHEAGCQSYYRQRLGLDPAGVVEKIQRLLGELT
ncbi:MAG: transketolase C-terminal domain-containing protein [Planctomycetota bacterium]|jgi:transketolase|nr:transketolase C-terminal domain-containing protein [Planctomycetota bacterium]